jgi:hypothetical protein
VQISYLTRVDVYLLFSFTVLVLITIENGVVVLFPVTEEVDLPTVVDRYFLWILSGIWVVGNVYTGYAVYQRGAAAKASDEEVSAANTAQAAKEKVRAASLCGSCVLIAVM